MKATKALLVKLFLRPCFAALNSPRLSMQEQAYFAFDNRGWTVASDVLAAVGEEGSLVHRHFRRPESQGGTGLGKAKCAFSSIRVF